MLTYTLENTHGCSLYEALYRAVREDILSGRLSAGEKLPSKRTLAKHLGISVITVENAYTQLAAEGYVRPLPRQGFFVARLDALTPKSPAVPVEFPQRGGGEEPGCAYDLVTNHIPGENFPFSIWSRLLRGVLSEGSDKLLRAPSVQGVPELQQAICRHLERFRGMSVRPEQIVIGAGTEYLYGLVVQLLGRDKIYGVEEPGYQKPARIYESYGARCAFLPIDEQGMRSDTLEQVQVDVLHISPSHHFPTGVVMPVSRRSELLAWCARKEGRYILEDDYDCELRTGGKPIPPMQSIDAGGRVIYINTFSKTLASAMRISYMVLPPALAEEFRARLGFYTCTVSGFEQLTLARFIGEGHFERHLNRMRNRYRTQKEGILRALRESDIASDLTVHMANEGLHFLLEIRTCMSDEALLKLGEEYGLRMACLSRYYHGTPEQSGIIVVNYAGLRSADTPAAVEQLLRCLRCAVRS